MKRLYGISTALLTPFDAEGRLDKAALKDHCDYLIRAGVHCLYALGTTGEALLMERREREKVAEVVVDHVCGRVPVFIHIGAIPTETACSLARHAMGIGADGIGAVAPYYFNVSQREIRDYYIDIAGSVADDYPVYLYNLPGCTVNDLADDTAVELAAVGNVAGIKTSIGDFIRFVRLVGRAPKGFDVIQGYDSLLMPSLLYGARGSVSGNSNVVPELFVALYDSILAEDYPAARRCQEAIDSVVRLLGGGNIVRLKEALHWRGFRKTYARKPLQGSGDADGGKARTELEAILSSWEASRNTAVKRQAANGEKGV